MSAVVAGVSCKSLKSLGVSMCAEVAEVSCKCLTEKGFSKCECVPLSIDRGAAAPAAPLINEGELASLRDACDELRERLDDAREEAQAVREAATRIVRDLLEQVGWLDLPDAYAAVEGALEDLEVRLAEVRVTPPVKGPYPSSPCYTGHIPPGFSAVNQPATGTRNTRAAHDMRALISGSDTGGENDVLAARLAAEATAALSGELVAPDATHSPAANWMFVAGFLCHVLRQPLSAVEALDLPEAIEWHRVAVEIAMATNRNPRRAASDPSPSQPTFN